jgi:HAD superfamily hydrolase (TIGR01549 family)
MPVIPRALLLDFGGVIAEAAHHGPDPEGLVELLAGVVDGAVPAEVIASDLEAGAQAYAHWADAMARPYAPLELSHRQFWSDFVCADWPTGAREAVLARASELAYELAEHDAGRRMRDGVVDLLDVATGAGIPVAVVSNTLCGAAFRDFLAGAGVGDRFAAQVYSDETGFRKPNPAMVRAATDALGVAPADVWFVGDTPLRDILAARRAGVGFAILVRSERVVTADPRAVPDVSVDSMVEVHRLLADAIRGS